MRTLKKVLALTVVLATLFSLTAFAFSDADQINEACVEEVNLLAALNVMVGDTDGAFRPNDTISRAEAAKMVYVVRNGGNDDKAAGWTGGAQVFADVPAGIWYEGYVNYCASLGIIAGYNGQFRPNDPVTGVELAKMLLVVASYKADVEGYTGADWASNVINDAQLAGIFEGYAIAYDVAAPRQWAAKMFVNAILNTEMAVYIAGERVNDLSMVGASVTVGEKYFNLETVTGILTGTNYVKQGTTGSVKEIVVKPANEAAVKFLYEAGIDLLQQEVTVVYDAVAKAAGKTDYVYALYATGKSNAYEVNFCDITFKAASDNSKLSIEFEGYAATTYKAADVAAIDFYYNYNFETAVNTTIAAIKAMVAANENGGVKFIDQDGDGLFDVGFLTVSDYAVVSAYNASRNVFSLQNTFVQAQGIASYNTNGNADAFAKFVFVDEPAAKNVVKLTVDQTGAEDVIYVEVVEAVTTGKITKVDTTKTTVPVVIVVIDGVEYQMSAQLTTGSENNINRGTEVNLYTDGKFVVHVEKTGASVISSLPANVVMLVNAKTVNVDDAWGENNDTNEVTKIQVLNQDGTLSIIDSSADYSGLTKDALYVLTYDADGLAVLNALTTANLPTGAAQVATHNGDVDFTNGKFGGVLLNDASVMFVKYNTGATPKYTVVKGQFAKAITGTDNTNLFTISNSGITGVMVGVLNTAEASLTAPVVNYVQVVDVARDTYDAEGNEIQVLKVIDATGAEVELVLAAGQAVDTFQVFDFYKVTTTNGKSTLADEEFTCAALTGFDGTYVQLGAATLKINEKTVVHYVDKTATGALLFVEGVDFPLSEGGATNALYTVADGVVTNIIIEVDGEDISAYQGDIA